MTMLDEQLDNFVAGTADYDRSTGEVAEPAKPAAAKRSRKPRQQSKHIGAFDSGQPVPGEEAASAAPAPWAPHVLTAISAVTAGLAQTGIGKLRRNTQQGYNFRGIDDVYNALAGLLVQHKLVILPHVCERTVSERQARGGGVLNYVSVQMSFDLVSAVDGSREMVSSFGEAMDSGDKATNKALSTAYKYMAMQVFCIPTIGVDPEEDTYEVTGMPKPPAEPEPLAAAVTTPKAASQAETGGPSPEHVKAVLRAARELADAPTAEKRRWFDQLFPEDQKILRTAKAVRTRDLQS